MGRVSVIAAVKMSFSMGVCVYVALTSTQCSLFKPQFLLLMVSYRKTVKQRICVGLLARIDTFSHVTIILVRN